MNCDKASLLLYAVTDRSWLHGQTLYAQAEQALQGGATFLQLREKELDEAHFKEEAIALKALCKQYGVPFVLDDNVALAIETDADGVHVGQSDMAAGKVRELIGPGKILGVSAQTVDEALLAEREGADYLGVGAVFPTGTKTDANAVSYDTLREICAAVSIPVIANGDVFSAEDAVAILHFTGADAAMIGRGSFGNPWIFQQAQAALEGRPVPPLPPLAERCQTALRQIRMAAAYKGERVAVLEARKQYCWYLKGIPHANYYKEQIVQMNTLEDAERITRGICRDLRDQEAPL